MEEFGHYWKKAWGQTMTTRQNGVHEDDDELGERCTASANLTLRRRIGLLEAVQVRIDDSSEDDQAHLWTRLFCRGPGHVLVPRRVAEGDDNEGEPGAVADDNDDLLRSEVPPSAVVANGFQHTLGPRSYYLN